MTWGIPLKMAARKLRKTVTFISALLAWIQNNPSSTHKLIWEAQGESVCEQVQRALPASQQEEPLLALTRLKTLLKEPGAAGMRRRASRSIGVPPFLFPTCLHSLKLVLPRPGASAPVAQRPPTVFRSPAPGTRCGCGILLRLGYVFLYLLVRRFRLAFALCHGRGHAHAFLHSLYR
jgi:hypothetical protein